MLWKLNFCIEFLDNFNFRHVSKIVRIRAKFLSQVRTIFANSFYIMLLIRFVLIIFLIGLPVFSGCGRGGVEVVSETDEKQYQLAKDYQGQGRTEEALSAFLRVIDARREAPESHFEAGYIYLSALKDPVQAIYHFERYLQFKPDSPQAKQVRQLIETAQKEFARQLPAQPYSLAPIR